MVFTELPQEYAYTSVLQVLLGSLCQDFLRSLLSFLQGALTRCHNSGISLPLLCGPSRKLTIAITSYKPRAILMAHMHPGACIHATIHSLEQSSTCPCKTSIIVSLCMLKWYLLTSISHKSDLYTCDVHCHSHCSTLLLGAWASPIKCRMPSGARERRGSWRKNSRASPSSTMHWPGCLAACPRGPMHSMRACIHKVYGAAQTGAHEKH